MSDYSIIIRIEDASGNGLLELAHGVDGGYVSATWERLTNDMGSCTIIIHSSVPLRYLQRNNRIKIFRQVGETLRLENETWYFLTRLRRLQDENGVWQWEATGVDLNALLAWRVAANFAQNAAVDKTMAADNMIKQVASEQFGASPTDYAGAAAGRTWGGLAIDTQFGLAPTIDRKFAHRYLLDAFKEFCDESASQGTWLGFDVVDAGINNLVLRTYVGQRGSDRQAGSLQAVVLSVERGNIVAPVLDFDYTNEATHIYALGGGTGASRVVQTATDSKRIAAYGPYGRIERTRDARNLSGTGEVLSEAKAELINARPRTALTFSVVDVDGCEYGTDYFWGDVLTAEVWDSVDIMGNPTAESTLFTMNVRIHSVRSSVDENGVASHELGVGDAGEYGASTGGVTIYGGSVPVSIGQASADRYAAALAEIGVSVADMAARQRRISVVEG